MTETLEINKLEDAPTREIEAISKAMRKSVDIMIQSDITVFSPRGAGYHEEDAEELLQKSITLRQRPQGMTGT